MVNKKNYERMKTPHQQLQMPDSLVISQELFERQAVNLPISLFVVSRFQRIVCAKNILHPKLS